MTPIILGLTITLFSALISVYEKWKKKNESEYRRRNRITLALLVIAIAGAFLSFFAGYVAIKQRKISENSAIKRQEKIDSQSNLIYQLEKLNHSLISKDIEYSKRLDSSSYENYLLAKEISQQTVELKDYASGKGSYCHFDLGMKGETPNSYHLMLYSFGNNPMDNVIARIVDVFDMNKNPLGTIVDIGKVYPKIHTVRIFETTYTPVKPDSIWLNIFFQTGSREFVEELKQIRINGKWVVSKKVFDEKNKIVVSKVDKDFPKDF